MLFEHESGRSHLRSLLDAVQRRDAASFVEHAEEYTTLLEDHIRKEDEILFPAVDDMLDADGDRDIARRFARLEEVMADDATVEHFDKLLDSLSAKYLVKM